MSFSYFLVNYAVFARLSLFLAFNHLFCFTVYCIIKKPYSVIMFMFSCFHNALSFVIISDLYLFCVFGFVLILSTSLSLICGLICACTTVLSRPYLSTRRCSKATFAQSFLTIVFIYTYHKSNILSIFFYVVFFIHACASCFICSF